MSKLVKQLRRGAAGKAAGSRIFQRIDDLLNYYAQIAPGRNAILATGGTQVTYHKLRVLVDEAVGGLRSFGVGPTDRVAVVLPAEPETIVAILAAATAAVCVPLNPSFTADEWQRYFGDLQVTALLTRAHMDSASRGVAHRLGIPVMDLLPHSRKAPCAFELLGMGSDRILRTEQAPSGDKDAFILMTSGTTSRPKLVPLTHSSVCRSAYNAGAVLQLGPRDRLLNVLPLFHAHGLISALLTSLAAGSTVICTPGFDPAAFFSWLTEFRPTWYTAVPSIHRALLSEATHRKLSVHPSSLRIIRSASASLPPDVIRNLESLFGVPVIETYGMTEAASQIAANPLRCRKPGSVGQSAGAEIAIVNHEGRRLEAGERGEIVLRGPTIMRGYDGDVAATESAFRDGWFRTGDLGYLDRDGYLFIVGRLKDVIKRGGQQVAPAEVEETLLRHPDVVEAVAFAIPHRRLGEDVAAAVVLRTDAQVSAQALRNFARERLARFKLPGLIQIVPEIPKDPAGKIKRSGLAAALSMTQPSARVNRCRRIVVPRSELERQLAKTWAELLEINQIGVDQDVFALGADSLTVTQMLSRLQTHLGVDFSFKEIFDFPTVAALATHIQSVARNNLPPGSSTLHETPVHARSIHLSFQQQRIHVLSKLDPTGYNYHVVEAVLLSGPLDADALEASIAMICERHEVLRSTFLEGSGEPLQTVGTARLPLARFDLRTCDKIERAVAVQRHARESLSQSFELEKEPPLRAQLLWFDKDDHALVITLHHLVTDGWSQRLFWKELEAFYRAKVGVAPAGLPELPIQYQHFVEWQREWLGTRAAEEQLTYWRARLEGLTELPLRTDRNRPERWTGRGTRHPLKFSRALSRAIKSLSQDHRVTLFMTLLAAFQCLLYRYTQHEDIAVGSVIANRNQIKIENLMGMFANTIVLRTNLTGDPSFSEVLRRVRQVTLDAYRNQDLPLEEILRTLQVPRSVDRNALFQVMFVLQTPSPRALTLPGLIVRSVDVDPGIARVDLTLELIDRDEHLSGWLEYSTDLFEAPTMARMATHFRTLLEAIVVNAEQRISRLPILPAWERRRVLIDWNDTHTSLPHGTFLDRFANQVCGAPNEIAVSAGQVRLSYRELARRSSAIADRLTEEGVGTNVIVILLAERGIDFLAAMIAVQGAGGAFLPLDPKIPAARLATIIHHSRTPLLLAGRGCAAALENAISAMPTRARPQVLSLAKLLRAEPRDRARPVRPAPSSLAYVIYTSGSTGVPKGAMIEQRGFTNHLFSRIFDLRMSASDVVAQTAPQSFDISIWQFLTALMVGGRVHIFADDEVRDPVLLADVVSREKVTVLQIVPSLLRAILDQTPNESIARALSRLRWLICIGEPLAPDVAHKWQRLFPGVPLINAYGPAECSDTVATHRLAAPLSAPLGAVPIGRAIANTRLYVLDAHMQPVPIGVVGELCVGGTGVGRGYLNDPEQTRRSFLRDPFSHRRRARLYRTGDLARWRADGILEYIGRVDHQVKIRGYRVELEEIERVLLQHPDVRAAVVLSRDDIGGGAQLVAHIVAAGRWGQNPTELRDFLKMRLPEFMIPMGFIFLDRLPLTAHGKINRHALAAIREGLRVAASDFTAPRDSTEELLANIWADLLVTKNIGVFDNFFDLGGHSLLAGRVLSRVANAFGVSLPLRTLFEAPTISSLAQRVKEARERQSHEPALEIARLPVDGPHRASMVQEQVLKIERELPGLPQFNLPFAYRLQGALDIPALEQSLAKLVRRHDSLRTGFAWVDEVPVALIAPADDFDSSLSVEDLTSRTRTGKRAKALLVQKAALQAQQEAWAPFEIGRPPLFRTRLLRIGADDHILILILHHIIVDGWSIGVLLEELSEFYSAFMTGRRVLLPEQALQYSDFARWQRQWLTSDAANRQFAYWKDRLRNASPVFATTDDRGSALLCSRTAHEPIRFEYELATRLSAMSHRLGATLFMTLLAGFNTLLLARSGRNDVCVGTAMANRTQLRTEHVIGPLANTVLIRTRINTDLSFLEALSRVRNSVLEAYGRQELPFNILAARLAEEDRSDPGSLIQAFFILQNAFRPLELPNVMVESFAYPDGQRVLPVDRIWLSVMLKETPSGIDGLCSYKQDLFESKTLRNWMADYQSILAKAAANPETSLGRLANC